MHARSTTFRGDPDDLDAGIVMVRDEVMPAVLRLDGCVGMSMLVDRATGGSVVTSSWDGEQALRAAAVPVAALRDRAARLLGSRPEVREWEIAVLHRARPVPPGACARVTWTRVDPAALGDQVEVFRVGVVPQASDLPGFCSLSLLVDRASGSGATAVTYASRAAMERSRGEGADLRAAAAAMTSSTVLDVAEFEVAVAHLRVPETV